MSRKDHIDVLGALLLLTVMMLFGFNQSAVKIVNSGMHPLFQAGLRSLCAAPLIFLYAVYRNKPLSISDGSLLPGIVCGIFFASEFMLLFQALEYTTVSRASIFFYTMPFWVALAAHYWIPGETLTKIRTLGLVLAFVGVILALSSNTAPATDNAFIGDLMCIVGSMCWAGIAIVARTTKFSKAVPEMQLLYQLTVSAMIILPLAFLFGDTFREPTLFHWGIFAFQILVVVCAGFLTWFYVLSVYPASDMASFSFLAPLFGVLFGWIIFDDQLSWNIVIALALVGIGIVLVNRKRA